MADNRVIQLLAERRKNLLSVFFTAGYPRLHDTIEIAQSLEASGVDMIEIGIPFSDPIADGPVIQESNHVALANGMTVAILLEQVRELRKTVQMPVILMGYLNPVLQYGFEKFCKDASAAGADGLILPDLPLDEYESHYRASIEGNGLVHAFLISPTTAEDRIRRIDGLTKGFIYAVAASSTTGARKSFGQDQLNYFERLRAMQLHHPFLIGFGIGDQETFSKACEYGSGAIVGSAFISMLKGSKSLKEDVRGFVGRLSVVGSK